MKWTVVTLSAFLLMACSQESSHETKKEKAVKSSPLTSKQTPLICQDEKSKIACHLRLDRVKRDRDIAFTWISPSGNDNRQRTITLSAGHSHLYDMRLKKGRAKGTWRVVAKVEGQEIKTSFKL